MLKRVKKSVNNTVKKYAKPIDLLKQGKLLLAGVQLKLTDIVNPIESVK